MLCETISVTKLGKKFPFVLIFKGQGEFMFGKSGPNVATRWATFYLAKCFTFSRKKAVLKHGLLYLKGFKSGFKKIFLSCKQIFQVDSLPWQLFWPLCKKNWAI